MNNFVKIIKEKTGLSIGDFCEKELNARYNSFSYRVRTARLTPAEIFYIVIRTKTSVQELFGADLQELLVNSIEGDFAEKVKSIIRDLSEVEQRDFAHLTGFQVPAPTPPRRKKKTNQKRPVSSEKKESSLDRIFKNTYL